MLPHGLCEARAFVDAIAVCCDCRGFSPQISKEINSFQLKPEGGSSVSSLVSRAGGQPGAQPGEPPQVAQVLHIPVDQKLAPHDLNKVGDNMVSTQVISTFMSNVLQI